eukprot:scaffold72471_cov70-Attheya_sp.AAC.2
MTFFCPTYTVVQFYYKHDSAGGRSGYAAGGGAPASNQGTRARKRKQYQILDGSGVRLTHSEVWKTSPDSGLGLVFTGERK